MRRLGHWYSDETSDIVYLISPAPKEGSVMRYHAILFYDYLKQKCCKRDNVRWCTIFFRAKDWKLVEPGDNAYQQAIMRIFDGEEG